MKRLLKYSALFLLTAILTTCLLAGPGRIYGLMKSQEYEGQITDLRALESEKEQVTKGFLIELHCANGDIHIFASSDQKWIMIKPKDWVRVRLFPTPPWAGRGSHWQNGTILSQIAPPPPKPQVIPQQYPPPRHEPSVPNNSQPLQNGK